MFKVGKKRKAEPIEEKVRGNVNIALLLKNYDDISSEWR